MRTGALRKANAKHTDGIKTTVSSDKGALVQDFFRTKVGLRKYQSEKFFKPEGIRGGEERQNNVSKVKHLENKYD